MSVRVVSYNLLVPIYAEEPGYYFKCNPKFLKTKYRWNLIRSQLQNEITYNKNTIVCLQELSRTLLPEIERFFHQQNYRLFHKLYGEKHNDYMGVGIAIPSSMALTSVNFIKVADQIRSYVREKKDTAKWGNRLRNYLVGKSEESVYDPWEIAMTKDNILIFLQVFVNGIPLCIGTYHMPCTFTMPDVMIIHASMVKDLMLQLAHGQNFIFAGDFNTQPTDDCYRVITDRGYVRYCMPQSNNYLLSYRPNAEQVLKSAYREKNGVEPVFTNLSVTSKRPYFCATLDYIFFHGRLIVDNVLPLPNRPKSEAYPDAKHPSDHLMIAASFRLF